MTSIYSASGFLLDLVVHLDLFVYMDPGITNLALKVRGSKGRSACRDAEPRGTPLEYSAKHQATYPTAARIPGPALLRSICVVPSLICGWLIVYSVGKLFRHREAAI